jgi:hypothetical protein
MGELNLDLYDYLDELQCPRPGSAVALFQSFREHECTVPLMATLAALGRGPNPLLLDELYDLARTSADRGVVAAAYHAAAYTGADAAVEALEEASSSGGVAAGAAFALAIGCNRSRGRAGTLIELLNSPSVLRDASYLEDTWHNALWAAGELARDDDGLVEPALKPMVRSSDPYARGLAWLGLAKACESISEAELDQALDAATDFVERLLIATAGALMGYPTVSLAVQATVDNSAPVYRLLSHLERDVRTAFVEGGVTDLCTLLDLGDFT